MVDDDKPDPIDDLKRGLGLLLRAAKGAAQKLPSDKLENIVMTGVKEVGRAIENVTDQIDRQVFGGKGTIPHPEDHPSRAPAGEARTEGTAAAPSAPGGANEAEKPDAEKKKSADIDPNEEPPVGPRVGPV